MKAWDTVAFNFGFPFWPPRVVTRMTPFAPFAPKTAVAEASFRTEIVAISLGSKVLNERSTPSTITSGAEPFQLEIPRTKMEASSLPGWPEDCKVTTPDSLPAMACVILVRPELTMVSVSIWEMAPTTDSFRWTP